ncbi:hypothetical protein [Capnocytophaga bilenii]
MKTVFKVGMEVYDQIFFGETPLKITEVKGDMTLRVLYGEVTYCYTGDGRFIGEDITSNRHRGLSQTPTLSTSPYTFDGFEQKAPAPTYEEVVRDKNYIYLPENLVAPNKELADATKALLKLLFLRDYYNEGWQPDWEDENDKFCIQTYKGELNPIEYSFTSRPLFFKTRKIRNNFIEEQKELLEIAKPLL